MLQSDPATSTLPLCSVTVSGTSDLELTLHSDKFNHHRVDSKALVGLAFHLHLPRDLIAGNEHWSAETCSDTHFGVRLGCIHGLHCPQIGAVRRVELVVERRKTLGS